MDVDVSEIFSWNTQPKLLYIWKLNLIHNSKTTFTHWSFKWDVERVFQSQLRVTLHQSFLWPSWAARVEELCSVLWKLSVSLIAADQGDFGKDVTSHFTLGQVREASKGNGWPRLSTKGQGQESFTPCSYGFTLTSLLANYSTPLPGGTYLQNCHMYICLSLPCKDTEKKKTA